MGAEELPEWVTAAPKQVGSWCDVWLYLKLPLEPTRGKMGVAGPLVLVTSQDSYVMVSRSLRAMMVRAQPTAAIVAFCVCGRFMYQYAINHL